MQRNLFIYMGTLELEFREPGIQSCIHQEAFPCLQVLMFNSIMVSLGIFITRKQKLSWRMSCKLPERNRKSGVRKLKLMLLRGKNKLILKRKKS